MDTYNQFNTDYQKVETLIRNAMHEVALKFKIQLLSILKRKFKDIEIESDQMGVYIDKKNPKFKRIEHKWYQFSSYYCECVDIILFTPLYFKWDGKDIFWYD